MFCSNILQHNFLWVLPIFFKNGILELIHKLNLWWCWWVNYMCMWRSSSVGSHIYSKQSWLRAYFLPGYYRTQICQSSGNWDQEEGSNLVFLQTCYKPFSRVFWTRCLWWGWCLGPRRGTDSTVYTVVLTHSRFTGDCSGASLPLSPGSICLPKNSC